jgi:predicted ATPase
LRYFCSPYQKDTPLYPVTARWEREAGFVRGDSGSERLQKLQATMEPDTPSDDFSLIADVLNMPAEGRQKLELSPQRRRERTFGLLLNLLRKRAEREPVLMLLEDIHWSDASTMELFDLLIGELPNLRVLLVVSFRPEHSSPWIGQAGVTLLIPQHYT